MQQMMRELDIVRRRPAYRAEALGILKMPLLRSSSTDGSSGAPSGSSFNETVMLRISIILRQIALSATSRSLAPSPSVTRFSQNFRSKIAGLLQSARRIEETRSRNNSAASRK